MENSWVAAHVFYSAMQGAGVLCLGMVVVTSATALTKSVF